MVRWEHVIPGLWLNFVRDCFCTTMYRPTKLRMTTHPFNIIFHEIIVIYCISEQKKRYWLGRLYNFQDKKNGISNSPPYINILSVIELVCNVYPFVRSCTTLMVCFPRIIPWQLLVKPPTWHFNVTIFIALNFGKNKLTPTILIVENIPD